VTAPLHVVVGASGQIGTHLVRALESAGHRVRAVTRTARRGHVCGDISDVATAIELCAGASVVHACFGGPHATWHAEFPRMTRGVIAGAKAAGARIVFADNLYAYGPHHGTLTEESPVRPAGTKQRLRAEIAELFLRSNVPVAIARASDLYGPGIDNAMVNTTLIASALVGRRLFLPGVLDAPHTFTFVPDVARAMVRLATSDDAWGHIWHVPSAPALSLRALVAKVGDLGRNRPHVTRIPTFVVRLAGLFDRQIRELAEMAFQWDRPYLVSHAKIAGRYGLEPTAIDDGLRTTADALATARRK
jgi:nucleoside-diphosphate-sugar epimerase